MTYSSAGDAGDLCYAMATVRALGGGTLCLHAEKWTRELMNNAKVASLKSLLEIQPYIDEVRWLEPGEQVTTNLNDFRAEYFRTFLKPGFPVRRNLCEWMLVTHGVPVEEQNNRWLTNIEPIQLAKVVINRTPRYHNKLFPWKKVLLKYGNDVGFVGSNQEHQQFCNHFGQVPRIQTDSLLALAQVIAGAELFIGNQSCPYAIAEGMKKRAILEVCRWLPNCLFERADVIHGWDANFELPEL